VYKRQGEKRAIVYFGDTINTAARLQALCKEKERDFLVSGWLLDRIGGAFPKDMTRQDLGELPLKGKAEHVEVYAIDWERASGLLAAS